MTAIALLAAGSSPLARGQGAGGQPPPAGGAGAQGGAPALPFPRGYRLEVSLDGAKWGKPVAEGKGSGTHTAIAFAPTRAKFVRITQTETVENAPNWSIANRRVYEPGAGK